MPKNTSKFFGSPITHSIPTSYDIVKSFTVGEITYLFCLKSSLGWFTRFIKFLLRRTPHTMRIYVVNGNQISEVESRSWSTGWTIATFYNLQATTFLFLLKERNGLVHIHEMNANGTIGSLLHTHHWTSGWTIVEPYLVNGMHYLFFLKYSGYGADGNNVHLHEIDTEGNVGSRVSSHKWTTGWTTVQLYTIDNQTYLFLLKKYGYGSDGTNVHIHAMNANGRVGAEQQHYKWTEGWSDAIITWMHGRMYLFLYKNGSGTVHLHVMNNAGTVSTRVATFQKKPADVGYSEYGTGSEQDWGPLRWSPDRGYPAWTSLGFYKDEENLYTFRYRESNSDLKIQTLNPMEWVGPMVGRITPSSVIIWMSSVGLNDPPNMLLRYTEQGSPTTQTVPFVFNYLHNYYNPATAEINELQPGTKYDYEVVVGSIIYGSGTFSTAVPNNEASSFEIIVSSCMDVGSNRTQDGWAIAGEHEIAFHIMTGDNAYPNTTNRDMIWAEHLQQRGVDNFAEVIRKTPTYSTWDDHDFDPNNSKGASDRDIDRDESAKAFRELFANPNYVEDHAIYYSFIYGQVEFFVLDNRYYRRSDQMLGENQFQWLENGLQNSSAKFKVIITGTTTDPEATENWTLFSEDYDRLRDAIVANAGTVLFSGDLHDCKIKPQDYGGCTLWEFISSGIGRTASSTKIRGFIKVRFDTTTLDQETLHVWVYDQDGTPPRDEKQLKFNGSNNCLESF